MQINLIDAHNHSFANRKEVEKSTLCYCFYCLKAFNPNKVKKWTNILVEPQTSQTAICPFCNIDAIIGNVSRLPVDDFKFLKSMHDYWFTQKEMPLYYQLPDH